MTDAIKDDAQEDVNNEEIEDARHDAIEALVSKRDDEIASEVAEAVGDKEESLDIENYEEDNSEVDSPDEELVKVKIDGEEIELTLSELKKGYQKDATASRRLEQAALERQQLEQDRLALEAERNKLQNVVVTEPEEKEELDEGYANKLQNAFDDLSVGDEEERIKAANVIKEMLGGRSDNPAIPEEQIVAQATKQATENALLEIKYNDAQQSFLADYQDIVADDTLYSMAMAEFDKAVPYSQTYEQAFKTAGDNVRQWKDGLTGSTTDKVALKKQLQREPVSTGIRAEPTPEKLPDSPSDIIQAMKASRGQPT